MKQNVVYKFDKADYELMDKMRAAADRGDFENYVFSLINGVQLDQPTYARKSEAYKAWLKRYVTHNIIYLANIVASEREELPTFVAFDPDMFWGAVKNAIH